MFGNIPLNLDFDKNTLVEIYLDILRVYGGTLREYFLFIKLRCPANATFPTHMSGK